MAERVVLLVIPQLRSRDVTPGGLSVLETLGARGSMAPLLLPFPALPGSSAATFLSGLLPTKHGILGAVTYDRSTRQLVPIVFDRSRSNLAALIRERRPDRPQMSWCLPEMIANGSELTVSVDPRGGIQCSNESLRKFLQNKHSALPSTDPHELEPDETYATWQLDSSSRVIAEFRPSFGILRVPYLAQVACRFGPESNAAGRAVYFLNRQLESFLEALPERTAVVAVTESIVTLSTDTVFPNSILRDRGLLKLQDLPSGGTGIDFKNSEAFAIVDHQFCRIFVNDPSVLGLVVWTFTGDQSRGIQLVSASNQQREILGIDHPNAGEVTLVATPDASFEPSWWKSKEEEPVIPSEAGLRQGLTSGTLLGSFGAPPPDELYRGLIICSERDRFNSPDDKPIHAEKVLGIVSSLLD